MATFYYVLFLLSSVHSLVEAPLESMQKYASMKEQVWASRVSASESNRCVASVIGARASSEELRRRGFVHDASREDIEKYRFDLAQCPHPPYTHFCFILTHPVSFQK